MTSPQALQLGDIRIERILEMEMPFLTPGELYMDATPEAVAAEAAWLEPWALCPASGKLIFAIQSYLVRTSRHVVLIDSCVGCDKANDWFAPWHRRADQSWLSRLQAAGVTPEAVDYVFCTHLHSDHIGWNTLRRDGRWVPTFPNAKYVMAREEVAPYQAQPNESYEESILPVIEAGQAILVETDHALDDELQLLPTPGHTPGHVAVRLTSKGREAVMCGDLIHSPIQCAHPAWRYRIDDDPALANATRRAFLEDNCGLDRLVLTAHFPSPSIGRVVEKDAAFGFSFL